MSQREGKESTYREKALIPDRWESLTGTRAERHSRPSGRLPEEREPGAARDLRREVPAAERVR